MQMNRIDRTSRHEQAGLFLIPLFRVHSCHSWLNFIGFARKQPRRGRDDNLTGGEVYLLDDIAHGRQQNFILARSNDIYIIGPASQDGNKRAEDAPSRRDDFAAKKVVDIKFVVGQFNGFCLSHLHQTVAKRFCLINRSNPAQFQQDLPLMQANAFHFVQICAAIRMAGRRPVSDERTDLENRFPVGL